MHGTERTPATPGKDQATIGKFLLWKLVAGGLLFIGINLLWLGISGLSGYRHVHAPSRAIVFGLMISAFGALVMLLKRNGKFLWQ